MEPATHGAIKVNGCDKENLFSLSQECFGNDTATLTSIEMSYEKNHTFGLCHQSASNM